jgi:hypothetical protein
VSVLTDLDAFFTDHHRCGELDAGVDDVMVWIACDCGASMARRIDVVSTKNDRVGRRPVEALGGVVTASAGNRRSGSSRTWIGWPRSKPCSEHWSPP